MSDMGVVADLLGLRILVRDAADALGQGGDFAAERRAALADAFGRAALPRPRFGPRADPRLPLAVVARTMDAMPAGVSPLDLARSFAAGAPMSRRRRSEFAAFLGCLDRELDRARAGIDVGRYL